MLIKNNGNVDGKMQHLIDFATIANLWLIETWNAGNSNNFCLYTWVFLVFSQKRGYI